MPAVLYTVLVVYNLLPIASISQATIVGVFVGAAHLTTFVLLFQKIHGEGKLDIELVIMEIKFSAFFFSSRFTRALFFNIQFAVDEINK